MRRGKVSERGAEASTLSGRSIVKYAGQQSLPGNMFKERTTFLEIYRIPQDTL